MNHDNFEPHHLTPWWRWISFHWTLVRKKLVIFNIWLSMPDKEYRRQSGHHNQISYFLFESNQQNIKKKTYSSKASIAKLFGICKCSVRADTISSWNIIQEYVISKYMLYMYCCWRSNYQEEMIGIPLAGLTPPLFCVCPKSGHA